MTKPIQSHHSAGRSRTAYLIWLGLFVLMTGIAAATGRLEPHWVDDTSSYLGYPTDSIDAALRSTRMPGYPLLLKAVLATLGVAAIPWIQIAIHAASAAWLASELRRWGTSSIAAISAALAVALGCTFMDHISTLATNAPAASIGVMAAVAVMRWVRLDQSRRSAILVALLCTLAITLRPAYLAMIPWTLLIGVCCRYSPAIRSGATIGSKSGLNWLVAPVVITMLLLAWITLRGVMVDDFGVLPFGHQNLAGITIQLVTEDELLALDGEAGKLGAAAIHIRDQRIAGGLDWVDGDPAATMTMEGRWNDWIYQAVTPAASTLHGHDSITNHNAIAAMNKEILSRYPMRYVRWLALAARRAVWASVSDVVMHPLFLTGIGLAVILETRRVLMGVRTEPGVSDHGLAILFVIAITYFVVQIGFVILTSPPLGRFADAVAILIPAWIAAKMVQRFS